jgi:hypothetical protein
LIRPTDSLSVSVLFAQRELKSSGSLERIIVFNEADRKL